MELIDSFGRKITYLRIGVTDRCNLRCRYCMPEDGIDFSKRSDLLSYEEIVRLAKVFKSLGVNKARITGGEPFVRKDIDLLLTRLSTIFDKLHITTNATSLSKNIALLKDINIAGLNISLDTLDRNTFQLITRRDNFNSVWSNMMMAIDAGIKIKVNVVLMRGVNDHEIFDFINFAEKYKVEVRFIEAMPFNQDDGNKSLFIPAKEMLERITKRYHNTVLVKNLGISSSMTYDTGSGTRIGIIPAYSRTLCGSCNRIRLTPKGELITCLYAEKGIHLLPKVRDENIDDNQLITEITQAVWRKKENGFLEEISRNDSIFQSMTTIGG